MKQFPNIEGMCNFLRTFGKAFPGFAGAEEFKRQIQVEAGYTPEQADVYAATLFSRNSEDSPDNAKANADALCGSWTYMAQTGNPLGYMKTVTETWHFGDNLHYEHKMESYAAIATTGLFLQSSYSSPRIDVDRGFWAPSDAVQPEGVDVAIISFAKRPERLKCQWAGSGDRLRTKFSIYGRVFVWE